MQDIIIFINTPSDWALVVFTCFFSLGIALFYTLVISALYTKSLPNKTFFLLFPFIIIASKLIFDINTLSIIIFLFVLLVFSFFIGIFFHIIHSISQTIKKRAKTERISSIFFSIIKDILLVIVAVALMLFMPAMFFILIFLTITIKSFMKYNNKNSYLNLQANLPTSKIRSMAMGLVEVRGKALILNPLQIRGKECIGYRYLIQKVEYDSDETRSCTTISDKIHCNDFEIEDDTGKVTVKAKDIDFKWIKEDYSYYDYDRQHTQYLLFEGDEVLIIANATSSGNETYLHKKSTDSIFTLAPFDSVTLWNTSKPLLNSLLFFGALFLISLVFILYLDIALIKNTIVITWPASFETFDFKELFKKLFQQLLN